MKFDQRIVVPLRREFSDWRLWWSRAVVIAASIIAGLTVVGFTGLGDRAFEQFARIEAAWWWAPLLWTPLCAGAIVWLTRRYADAAAGSGIPQVMATLDSSVDSRQTGLFVSVRLHRAGRPGRRLDLRQRDLLRVDPRPAGRRRGALAGGLLTAVLSGIAGGLFSRLLLVSLGGRSLDAFTRWRRERPVAFAIGCGLLVAAIGVVTRGATFGSGYAHTKSMLDGNENEPTVFVLFKFIATWLTAWSGVPAGIFAPSLSIGAALGHDVAIWTAYPHATALIALGMAGFLAAATQAPLTAFIIVMEMVDGHSMVLSLMACALIASGVSKLLSRPLYATLAQLQLDRLPGGRVVAADDRPAAH
ncbi:MAG TPA: chloride channel protein [Burkholderiaceae bacterium]